MSDFINLCNDQQLPEKDFYLTFCARCSQSECARSIVNRHGRFEDRVTNWYEQLFTQVPRVDDPGDSRVQQANTKKFIMLDVSRPYEVQGSWIDPLQPASEPPPVPKPGLTALNTPFQQGTMLSSSPPPQKSTLQKPDPWAGPVPKSGEVVPLGAKIRLGGGGKV